MYICHISFYFNKVFKSSGFKKVLVNIVEINHENPHVAPMMCAALLAAILPGLPMTPPPGCAPAPHSRRLSTGVAGPGREAGVGRARYSWSSDIAPWKMLPPVSPNTLSSSGGGRTSLPTTLSLKPGAYLQIRNNKYFYDKKSQSVQNVGNDLSMLSNTTSAYSSFFASSQVPFFR